jgi:transcriptional regulator with PAS, ATPase and Fis domain
MKPVIVGNSPNIQKIRDLIVHVADTGLNTVISGETGVGKELIAQALYYYSPRKSMPFIKVNCAALPDGLLESELFGYERGAFTGADRKMKGKFELANKGVIFLDEIGDMSLPLQSKLLHVLQSGDFVPLGSEKMVRTDTWVIAATNNDLESAIAKHAFREDLFFRLNIINIYIEPLRNRQEDIAPLADHFLEQYSARYQKEAAKGLPQRLVDAFQRYRWPGNVREMQNLLKKGLVLGAWDEIVADLERKIDILGEARGESAQSKPAATAQPKGGNNHPPDFTIEEIKASSFKKIRKVAMDRVEKKIITEVLTHTGWNRTKASKVLQISYKTLLYKISDLEIEQPM